MDRRTELRDAIASSLEGLDDERTPLDLVGEIPLVESVIDEIVAERVAAARAQGLSWEAIAGRLGISRQAAHKRFVKGKRKKPGERTTRLEFRIEKPTRKR